ncbi:MAG: hypothetical protein WCV50_06355 [Patescibacteria group bacterium]
MAIIKEWLVRERVVISYIVLLLSSFVLFTFFQAVPTLADPDSFYHIKMALLLPEQGIIKSFPWLQDTILKQNYIDQHFLYHVFLVPFTRIMNPIQGAKLATIILNTGLILFFYWFLRKYRIKLAFVFTFVLLLSMPFIFRINLIKAPTFSILFLILGLHFLFQHRTAALFILSFLYVWAYGGFILILFISGAYFLVSFLYDGLKIQGARSFRNMLGHGRELRLFMSSLAGVAAGLLVNFNFPQNIYFYWHQLVKIGIVNYQKVISVGSEWYPNKFFDLTANTAFVSALLILVIAINIYHFKKPSKKTITMFLVALLFFIFTLKSRRYVEYYVPFTIIFVAFALNEHMKKINFLQIWRDFLAYFVRHKIVVSLFVIYFFTIFPAIVTHEIRQTYRDFQGGIKLDRFSASANWLKENSADGDIVFHSSWDEFPVLFYHNSKDYYIIGLDPTFTYEYDKNIYQAIVDITLGRWSGDLHKELSETFHSSYVFVESTHYAMDKLVRSATGFQLVYEDEEAKIYKVL